MTESTEKSSLILLQNRMKKDPESYKDSFDETYKKFNELWKTFLLNPSSHEEELISLVMFLAQVCQCYKEYAGEFASQIKLVLSKHGPQLDADMRLTFCKVLILLRNKDLVSPVEILKLFFELFRCSDKVLRETLKNYIIHDIKNINMKSKNVSLNSELQNFMFLMLKDGNIAASKISLDIVIDLYHRKIWNNARTANIISTALFSKAPKMVMAALKFFTGTDEEDDEDNDSDDDDVKPTETRNAKQLQLAYRVGKKNNKREKRMKRALEMIQNQKKKKKKVNTCFSAIHLLNDPQDLADRVFGQLDRPKVNEMLNVRMMKLKFVSQLVGTHKLILLQYYPFMDRYLKPSQRDVTKILLYLAQACHEIVPPDVVTSSIRTIVNNFVSEHNSNEVMAVGLNAVREICNRCPLAMDADLLHDLALYKKYKDKCVSMAAQSLIGLFRSKNPELLHRSFLGKPTVAMAEKEKVLEYGVSGAKDYLPGAEILPDEEELKQQEEEEAWESCSEDEDDDDGSWVDVSHSSDEGENNEEENAVKEMTQEERVEKSRKVFETRILTEEDFKKIESYQKKKESEFFKKGNNKREHSEAFPEEGGELLALSNIENVHKKRKHDKESRLATVMAGREGRTKFGEKKGRSNEFASTSNKEKLRNKNFMMVRQKVKKNSKKATFHDKKETLKKYLLSKLKQKSK